MKKRTVWYLCLVVLCCATGVLALKTATAPAQRTGRPRAARNGPSAAGIKNVREEIDRSLGSNGSGSASVAKSVRDTVGVAKAAEQSVTTSAGQTVRIVPVREGEVPATQAITPRPPDARKAEVESINAQIMAAKETMQRFKNGTSLPGDKALAERYLPVPVGGGEERGRTGPLDDNGGTWFSWTGSLAIPDASCPTAVTAPITTSGLFNVQDVEVKINGLTHTWDSDLCIYLRGPNNVRVALSTGNGLNGDNYINTVFDDGAWSSITYGAAPFTGSYRSEELLSAFIGIDGNGTWTLEICDQAGGDVGTLTGWQIQIVAVEGDPLGRCCYGYSPNRSCADNTVSACLGLGGLWAYGQTCAANPCLPSEPGQTCANPIYISDQGSWTNTTRGMGNEYSNTCLGNWAYGEDIIYAWTVTAEAQYQLALTSTVNWVGIAVDAGCPLSSGACLAMATTDGYSTNATIPCTDFVPGTYYIMIDRYSYSSIPQFTLTITQCTTDGRCCYGSDPCNPDCVVNTQAECTALGGTWTMGGNCDNGCPIPPAGDLCCNALPLTVPGTVSGTTFGFADNYDYACSWTGGSTSPDVVYSYTPLETEMVSLSLCGGTTNFETKLYVYAGNCTGAPVACNDDGCSAPNYPYWAVSRIRCLPMTGGTTYYIVVDGDWGMGGNYTLEASIASPPPNDACENADLAPSLPWAFTGTTDCATSDCLGDDGEVWIAFTALEVSDISLNYCGRSGGLAVLALFNSCPCQTSISAANYEYTSCADGNLTMFWYGLAPGTYFYPVIRSEFYGSPGPYKIQVMSRPTPPPPPNDDCASVTPVSLPATFVGTRDGATPDCPNFNSGQGNVWIAFTTTDACDIVLDYCGTIGGTPPGNAWSNLVTSCTCEIYPSYASSDYMTCPDGNIALRWTSIPPGTYYYAVMRDEGWGATGPYTIHVVCAPPPTGRCCYGDPEQCAVNNQVQCTALAGSWIQGIDCTTPCPVRPACPDGAIFSQRPHLQEEWWSTYYSDVASGNRVYDNFSGLTQPIGGVRLWGMRASSSWGSCSEDPMAFEIKFFHDAGGAPDTSVAVCAFSVSAPAVSEWTYYDTELFHWDLTFPAACDLTSGWLMIAGAGDPSCWLQWFTSPYGGNHAYSLWGSWGMYPIQANMAFCLVGGQNAPVDIGFATTSDVIGCASGCANDTLYLVFSQVGFLAGQMYVDLPAGLDATWDGDLGYPGADHDVYPSTNEATRLSFAHARRMSATQLEVNVQWNPPPYSDGDASKYIAEIPLKATGANAHGTDFTISLNPTYTFWDLSGPHSGSFTTGITGLAVDCDAPAATLGGGGDGGSCNAYGTEASFLNQLTVAMSALGAGGAPVSPLTSATITLGANTWTIPTTNGTFPTGTETPNVWGAMAPGCNSFTMTVEDAKCNPVTTAAVSVVKDLTDPDPSVAYTQSTCYNNQPDSPQNGGTLLEADLDIDLAAALDCQASTFSLSFTVNGTPVAITGLSGLSSLENYPDAGQAVALWNAIIGVIGGSWSGPVTIGWTVADCAGNDVTGSFSIPCVDFAAPGNTFTHFNARPTHEGVWLDWSWDHTDAVYAEVWRKAESGAGYPTYPDQDWDDFAGQYEEVHANLTANGWTRVVTQAASVSSPTTSAEYTGTIVNNFWLDVVVSRSIYRYVTFVKDQAGNWSTVAPNDYVRLTNADRSTNYWLGDFNPYDTPTGDDPGSVGGVNGPDLDALAEVYFTPAGGHEWADINENSVDNEQGFGRRIPTPDNSINFGDLVPFSFNFGTTGPGSFNVPTPRANPGEAVNAAPVVTVTRANQNLLEVGSEFDVVVNLSGNSNSAVKAVEAMLVFDPQVLELVNVSSSTGDVYDGIPWSTVKPIAGTNDRIGIAAAAMGEIASFVEDFTMATVTFRWIADRTPETSLSIDSYRLADVFGATSEGEGPALHFGAHGIIPTVYALYQNYPNPFNPSTTIRLDLPEAVDVQLVIYNIMGQEVRTLVSGTMPAGAHAIAWNGLDNSGREVGTGMYIYRVSAGPLHDIKKMLLTR